MSALIALVLLPISTHAWDSVAVFHRPEKVIVLINEHRSDNRMSSLMDQFISGNDWLLVSEDQGMKFDCGRNETHVSCTLVFFKDKAGVEIFENGALANFPLKISLPQDLTIALKNSNGDELHLVLTNAGLAVNAFKKLR